MPTPCIALTARFQRSTTTIAFLSVPGAVSSSVGKTRSRFLATESSGTHEPPEGWRVKTNMLETELPEDEDIDLVEKIDLDLLDIDVDDPETLAEETTIGEDGTTAMDMVESITEAHASLTQIRRSSLQATAKLEEQLQVAEENGESEKVELLEAIRHNAYGLFLRLRRGDAELTGERDGEFTNYYNNAKERDT
jgi:hypothetical protein